MLSPEAVRTAAPAPACAAAAPCCIPRSRACGLLCLLACTLDLRQMQRARWWGVQWGGVCSGVCSRACAPKLPGRRHSDVSTAGCRVGLKWLCCRRAMMLEEVQQQLGKRMAAYLAARCMACGARLRRRQPPARRGACMHATVSTSRPQPPTAAQSHAATRAHRNAACAAAGRARRRAIVHALPPRRRAASSLRCDCTSKVPGHCWSNLSS